MRKQYKVLPRKITRENNQPNRKAKADTGTQYGWKAVSHLKAIGCGLNRNVNRI